MSDSDLENRFAALRAVAKDLGSDLDIHLTIGGVQVDELYRLSIVPDEPDTLEGRLTTMARLLDDPRTAAASQASRLMTEVEGLGKTLDDLIKTRQEEYRVAIRAFQSISTKPPLDKAENELAVALVSLARDKSAFQMLIDIAEAELARERAKDNQGGTDADTAPDDTDG